MNLANMQPSSTESGATTPAMTPRMYEVLDQVPDTYWRYVARHELFTTLWRRYRQPRSSYRVLDVGCGSGELLSYLMRRNPIYPVGIDLFVGTLPYCLQRGITSLSSADAVALPFTNNSFDLVLAQDVAEHIEDDAAALAQIYRVCAPEGLALILVPAFQFLWSARDVQLHHFRRYRLPQISERVRNAGFEIVHQTYTDLWLLPLLWAAVRLAPRTPDGLADLSGEAAPAKDGLANWLATTVSRAEAAMAYTYGLPFGVSAVVLGRKPTKSEER